MKKLKFHLKAFGCQMNVYDSTRIVSLLTDNEMEETLNEINTDIIILNTCYIREKASAKIFSELGRLYKLHLKKNKKQPVFAVLGCVAKAESENIFKRAPFVSIVLSSQKYHLLPELIKKALKELELIEKQKQITICESDAYLKKNDNIKQSKNTDNKDKIKLSHFINSELSGLEKFDCLPKVKSTSSVAFVQIQEGCDKFCTYCVVPNTRGREISRPEEDILTEVSHLASLGAIEINLLGQNVDAYNGVSTNGNKSDLSKLIKKVAKIDGIERIRYTTSYPSEFTDSMIQLHKEESKLAKLVYLPIQSGSNKILHKMNRRYTREEYLDIITKLKNINPEIQVSSDFIVGFPGETDEDFNETLDIVKKVKFIQCYAFKYSPRPGTPAAKMENQIDNKIKAERLLKLQNLLRPIQDDFNKSCVGKVMRILFTSKSKTNDDYLIGKNEYLQPVIVKADALLLNKIMDVKITSANYANLHAVLL